MSGKGWGSLQPLARRLLICKIQRFWTSALQVFAKRQSGRSGRGLGFFGVRPPRPADAAVPGPDNAPVRLWLS